MGDVQCSPDDFNTLEDYDYILRFNKPGTVSTVIENVAIPSNQSAFASKALLLERTASRTILLPKVERQRLKAGGCRYLTDELMAALQKFVREQLGRTDLTYSGNAGLYEMWFVDLQQQVPLEQMEGGNYAMIREIESRTGCKIRVALRPHFQYFSWMVAVLGPREWLPRAKALIEELKVGGIGF